MKKMWIWFTSQFKVVINCCVLKVNKSVLVTFFSYLNNVMGSFVCSSSSQLQSRSMLTCLISFHCNRLWLSRVTVTCSSKSHDQKMYKMDGVKTGSHLCWTYPWIIEGDPVLYSVAKSFKAQVSKFIEMIDHAYILPSTIFLLQDLEK